MNEVPLYCLLQRPAECALVPVQGLFESKDTHHRKVLIDLPEGPRTVCVLAFE